MNLDFALSILRYHLQSNGRLYDISKDTTKNTITIKNKLTLEERYIDFNEIQDFLQLDEFEYNLIANGFKDRLSLRSNVKPDSIVNQGPNNKMGSSLALLDKVSSLVDDEKDTMFLLLIGITGVGKSTFINMVINYIKYSCLQDAVDNATIDQIYTIASFVEIEDSDKKHRIQLGDVGDYKVGSAVTQYSRQYRIKLPDGKTLCLIDAPGVGDPKGTLQDNKHFENILHELSSLKKLNAICILMRPDETRATVLFSYCLNQLLLHLHSSAKDNIFFCFTHTRGTMYKPGPTKSILEEHLEKMKDQSNIEINVKDRIFCFDNESFNYLAAKLNGVTNFTDEDEFDYSRSWTRSSKELARLLNEISKVKPHDVANTVCINNARAMIGNLAQPMSSCISNINKNINLMKEQAEKLRGQSVSESLLYIPEAKLLTENLNLGHLVCTKKGCTSSTDKPCNTEIKPQKWFKSVYWCDNFKFVGSCTKCSNPGILPCLWYDHTIISIKETPQINHISSQSRSNISRTKSEIIVEKDELVSTMELRIKQFQSEYDTIKNAIVDFSVFLWQHSLIKVNRYYEEYINVQIKTLENSNNSEELIKKLNFHLSEYKASVEEQKKNVQNNIATVKSKDEIFETFDVLLKMPMVGYIIQDQIKLKQSNLFKSEAVEIDLVTRMKNKAKSTYNKTESSKSWY
ncbi:hypothetical protein RB653_000683 [Dictyostelium firmibasis]|uniref:G domain-containing protein n=1 Tax=Dictyostelium firmibasis TaxID=79012 RepID=A0AAN7U370_9MYCE